MDKCWLCQGDTKKYLTLNNVNLLKCKKCNLVFNPNKLDMSSLKNIYSTEYYSKGYFSSFIKIYKDTQEVLNYKKYLSLIEDYSSNKGQLLDVGCGRGVFLDIAKQNGWEVYGQEISVVPAAFTMKMFSIPVHLGQLKTLTKIGFNIVTMWDVIEHIDNGNEILKEVKRVLKRNGILFIWTINEDSLISKLSYLMYRCGIKFAAKKIYIEEHRNYYNQKNLIKLLEQNGFKVKISKLEEFPITRYKTNIVIRTALRIIFKMQRLLNMETEQIILCQKL